MTDQDRRAFVKHGASVLAGTAALGIPSGVGSATARDQSSGRLGADRSNQEPSTEERIRSTDVEAVRETYREAFGEEVASEVVDLWQKYANAVLEGAMTEQEAHRELLDRIADISLELEVRVDEARKAKANQGYGIDSEHQRRVAAGNLHPSDDTVTILGESDTGSRSSKVQNTDVGVLDTQDVLLIDGDAGGSGITGFRDSNYYTGRNKVIAICEQAGIGDLSSWAWLEGNVYVQNGGAHEVVCDYFENGWILGGSAAYHIWVQEEGESHKNWEALSTTSSSVYGNDSRSAGFYFSSDTVYNIGVRLKTETSGIGEALADFQTINADGSTRGLEINDLNIQPA